MQSTDSLQLLFSIEQDGSNLFLANTKNNWGFKGLN